jgi:two-component system response regulator HydG
MTDARILVVDDEPDVCELIELGLTKRGFKVESTTRARDALAMLRDDQAFDVLLTDLRLDDMDGLALCERVVENHPDLPVVVLTGHGSLDTAIGAIRVGAYDFITKPVDMESLEVAIRRATHHRRLSEEVKRLRDEVGATRGPREMVGQSGPMRRVYELIERLGTTDATILISGESGTGKELVARALHQRSAHHEGPFVAINCAAVPANLLESELFGHVKGAFTDARRTREGLFVRAGGGTLFLDEIGEMPLEMQAKLLRALQERRVRPVGGDQEIHFDTRIIAATNRELEAEVEAGNFREDLYYRINVVQIAMPRLAERGNDILLLAQHFVESVGQRMGRPIKGFSQSAAQKLLAYDWPGNVRELENSIERAVALARYEEIQVEDLPSRVREHEDEGTLEELDDPSYMLPLEELERRHIQRALKACSGNKTRAAKVLGVDRRTLYRKLERYAEKDAEARRASGAAPSTNNGGFDRRSAPSFA